MIHGIRAEVLMAGIFSDDMILQRGMEARVWGHMRKAKVVNRSLSMQ
jgi:hypothetical protein